MDETALPETPGAVNEIRDEATTLSKAAPTGDFERDAALQLIVATFPNSEAALAAFRGIDGIKWAERAEQILLIDAAVVHRDEGNHLHVEDEQDWPGHMGALQGAGIGTILGMVAGPLGMIVGGAAGAAIGAAAAASSDAGMSDEQLREYASTLQPGTSMIIVAVANMWSAATAAILTRAGGDVKIMPITDEMARQLHIANPST